MGDIIIVGDDSIADIPKEYIDRLTQAIKNSNNRQVEVFDCLCREGKKSMINDVTIAISKYNDYEPHLFLKTLYTSGKLDAELVEMYDKNSRTCHEYFSALKNLRDTDDGLTKPEIYIQILDMYKAAESKIKDKLVLGYNDKKSYIDNVIYKFARTGSYWSYVIIEKIRQYFSKCGGELGRKAQNVVEDAILARKAYITLNT
ncbi:hypothetical protein fgpv_283 [Flamingopox virus FGPVKD09]|uniref:Uncharacterized protein n=1 Tax=Flamingopox virus FGPVKD09 TaxID=2059380 RepID=A0A2H4X2S3_9POXV|nr:hypothetical protein C1178_gp283 [Flamingopox virus FGPVKD09]AUD40361.1 hypothetical protein fgpv_283 [Flamingopox virus FGPVKD09]